MGKFPLTHANVLSVGRRTCRRETDDASRARNKKEAIAVKQVLRRPRGNLS